MAGNVSPVGIKTLEYLKKYPSASENAIAKQLHQDHPLLFPNVQAGRNAVRWHTGQTRNGDGRKAQNPILRNTQFSRENPFGIPESHAIKRIPFYLPKVNNNILLISDLHIPYHDYKALNCALKYGLKEKVNTIFINGDLLDCHQLSRFEKDPSKRSTYNEVEAAKEFLTNLRKSFPKAQIYYHLGNHDIRYERFMNMHSIMMKDMFGDDEVTLESRLNLIKLRIHLIGDRQISYAGPHLAIHHGHYIFKSQTSPVSPAKTIHDKMGMSMICGHTHKISEFTKTDAKGSISTCWSTGSLAELLPDYSPMANNYAHGFSHIIVHKDDTFTVRNFRVSEGKIL